MIIGTDSVCFKCGEKYDTPTAPTTLCNKCRTSVIITAPTFKDFNSDVLIIYGDNTFTPEIPEFKPVYRKGGMAL